MSDELNDILAEAQAEADSILDAAGGDAEEVLVDLSDAADFEPLPEGKGSGPNGMYLVQVTASQAGAGIREVSRNCADLRSHLNCGDSCRSHIILLTGPDCGTVTAGAEFVQAPNLMGHCLRICGIAGSSCGPIRNYLITRDSAAQQKKAPTVLPEEAFSLELLVELRLAA